MADLKPTLEQEAIINAGVNGDTFVVDATAGSGKTATLNMTAKAMGNRILYLVYNRAAAEDAKKVFPPNVEVKTTAALAFKDYREDYGHRILGPRIPSWELAKMLKINRPLELGESNLYRPQALAAHAVEAVKKFCYSSAEEITEKHITDIPLGLNIAQEALLKQEIVHWARKLWRDSLSPASSLPFSFDHAFKCYVMSDPAVYYDAIMLDEAQDSNDLVFSFIDKQYTQKIAVGDPCQELYGWRGAVNIMGRFEGERLKLSKSWRFGENIAEEAGKWLAHTGTGITISGNPDLDAFVTDGMTGIPDAILCRTNATSMMSAMAYMAGGYRVAVAGGTKKLEALAFAAGQLKKGGSTTHPELVAFKSWNELMSFTEESSGSDLKAMVGLINQYGVGAIIDACKQTVDERKGSPDVVVSTAHSAKGREWMSVKIAEDFKPPKPVTDPLTGDESPGPIPKSDAMLHYVAVTRARRHLDRSGLRWIDGHPALVRNTMAREFE